MLDSHCANEYFMKVCNYGFLSFYGSTTFIVDNLQVYFERYDENLFANESEYSLTKTVRQLSKTLQTLCHYATGIEQSYPSLLLR